MRGLGGLFFGLGRNSRNDPIKLVDPNPIHEYGNDVHSGDAGRDGYSRLSIADPNRQGDAPLVAGAIGRSFQGPSEDFEQ